MANAAYLAPLSGFELVEHLPCMGDVTAQPVDGGADFELLVPVLAVDQNHSIDDLDMRGSGPVPILLGHGNFSPVFKGQVETASVVSLSRGVFA